MSSLIIAFTEIRQDSEGRYCLNDLHKAAGGEGHHQPSKFFANQQARDLVSEIGEFTMFDKETVTPVVTVMGRTGGTYVIKELVYAYAMWIRPKFSLEVIRAYDTLQTQGVAIANHAAEDLLNNPLKYMERLLGQAKDLQAQNLILQQEKTEAVDVATVAVQTIGKVQRSLREVARKLPNVNRC